MEFHDYRSERPPKVGWYIWRLPHKFLEGLTIVFLAEYRERGAGVNKVLSPSFDHWDGYQVLLPKGSIEWADYDGDKPEYGHEVMYVEGIENAPCPFCGKVPKWVCSGRYINAGPSDTDYWYLACCKWFDGFGTRMANPRDLAEKRNKAIKAHSHKYPK